MKRGWTHSEIKLRTADIIPSVSRLYYHLLSAEDGARERKLVARATVRVTAAHGCEAVG